MPSFFNAKIRKYLKSRRLSSIKQLGHDRIILLSFGDEPYIYHLILELYSSGNIILTDLSFKIIVLLRKVTLDGGENEDTRFAVGEVYDISLVKQFIPFSLEKLTLSFNQNDIQKQESFKKIIKSALTIDYGPSLVDHCLAKIDPSILNSKTNIASILSNEEIMNQLCSAFQSADSLIKSIVDNHDGFNRGYVIKKNFSFSNNSSIESHESSYEEFHPFLFCQFTSDTYSIDEFPTFNQAVDDFFSKFESQKIILKQLQAEQNASKKLEAVKSSHQNQINTLENAHLSSVLAAEAIEANTDLIVNILGIVRSLLASGMDWEDLWQTIQEEKRKNNPLAMNIFQLKLDKGLVRLSLPSADLDENEEAIIVDIDIYQTAYANARLFYDSKKKFALNKEKTEQFATKAFISAQEKIQKELALATKQIPSLITKTRKPYWFEKFLWFITDENFLCIAGRDAMQNEILVKKYLRKGDIYLHADIHGAASVIVKNPYNSVNATILEQASSLGLFPPRPEDECAISPMTLHQAGTFSVCQSKAWGGKIIVSAWWVYDYQVSKTAPSGESLSTGAFMIRGKKNWLPPIQLTYGFGILFKVGQESVANHLWERRPWARGSEKEIDYEALFGKSNLDNQDDDENENENVDEIDYSTNQSIQDQKLDESTSSDSNPEIIDINSQVDKDDELLTKIEQQEGDDEIEFPDTQLDQSNQLSDENDIEFPDTQLDQTFETKPISIQNTNDRFKLLAVENTKFYTEEQHEESSSTSKKAHVSSKKRKELKKEKEQDDNLDKTEPNFIAINQPQKVRGKQGKQKKMNEKYKNQDEEDKELIMAMLASDKGPQPKGKKEKAKKKVQEESKERAEQYAKNKQNKEKETSKKHDEQSDIFHDETAFVSSKDRPIEETILNQGDWNMLDYLTYNPDESKDILQHAICVAGEPIDFLLQGPWQAIQKFKYKIKLQPGSTKRGKAAQTAIQAFIQQAKKSENHVEKQLIQQIPEQECISAMLAKVKLA